MAYILEKIGNTYNLPKKYFTCDAKSDLDGISLVDVPIGSEAYCIFEEESYILDSNKQWHKKKIGEDATGSVTAQADWNQNDENAPSYIKNRTHYSEFTEGIVKNYNLSETTFTRGATAAINSANLIAGNQYFIEFNGLQSVVTAQDTNINNIPVIYIGNIGIFTGETTSNDQYTYIQVSPDNVAEAGFEALFVNLFDSDITFSIYTEGLGMVETVHPINPKYIKDMYYENSYIETIAENKLVTGFTIEQEPIYSALLPVIFQPIVGETYTITWDGVNYECIASISNDKVYIGNENYIRLQGGGDIPFAILYVNGHASLLTESADESHTINISMVHNYIKKVDEKYLPPTAQSDYNERDENSKSFIKNKPFYANGRVYSGFEKRLSSYKLYLDNYEIKGTDLIIGQTYHIYLKINCFKNLAPSSLRLSTLECDAILNEDYTFNVLEQNCSFDFTEVEGILMTIIDINVQNNYITFTDYRYADHYDFTIKNFYILDLKHIDDYYLSDNIQRKISGAKNEYVSFDENGNLTSKRINFAQDNILDNVIGNYNYNTGEIQYANVCTSYDAYYTMNDSGLSGFNTKFIIEGTIKDFDSLDEISINRYYNFIENKKLITVKLPQITRIYDNTFKDCSNLTYVLMPNVQFIESNVFWRCHKLQNINFSNVREVGAYSFSECYSLTQIYAPYLTKIGAAAFLKCTGITIADFSQSVIIGSSAFSSCKKLETLILRSNTLCILESTSALKYTPINEKTGYIYVPKTLIEDYKVATNWSKFSSQFRAIEDYPDITGGVTNV